MTRTPILAFAAVVFCAHAAVAVAQSAPTPQADPPPTPQSAPAATPDMVVTGDAAAKADVERRNRRDCLRETGSRIIASANARVGKDDRNAQCAPAFGRVYTREEIERTGRVNIADALRTLDPTVH